MKRIFIWAVAVSALCSSCETEEELFAPETNKQTTALYQTKNTKADDYKIYQSIVKSFVYDEQQTDEENLLRFEQHVNRCITMYETEETPPYETIDLKQLARLKAADERFIENLSYTPAAKTMMYALLNGQYNAATAENMLNAKEYRLMQTLEVLHNDNGGNGYGDKDYDDRKTIAFAYGAQYSFTQAVLYAGAFELMGR